MSDKTVVDSRFAGSHGSFSIIIIVQVSGEPDVRGCVHVCNHDLHLLLILHSTSLAACSTRTVPKASDVCQSETSNIDREEKRRKRDSEEEANGEERQKSSPSLYLSAG